MHKITPNSSLPAALRGPLVIALVYDGLCTFEFAIAAEIFGLNRPEMGADWYRFAACGIEPGPLRAQGGLRVDVDGGMDLLAQAALIIVPGWKGMHTPVPTMLITALVAAYQRGARLASICSGAFVLAATGLLDGRGATTHWRYAAELQNAYPAILVDDTKLYVDDTRIYTSAGSAAGIDLMLHIVRGDFGAEAANSVARRLVLPAHRSGGQAQFVVRPVPVDQRNRLAGLLDSIRMYPARHWSITAMAGEVAMSERSFLRRFFEATGNVPGKWLAEVRVNEACRLLESTTRSIEEVSHLAGFGSIAALRYHFGRARGISPSEYRTRFRHEI